MSAKPMITQKVQAKFDEQQFDRYRTHIIKKINDSKITAKPFFNLYIEGFFPEDFYNSLKEKMLLHKYSGKLQERHQDSEKFTNNRFSLVKDESLTIQYLRNLLNDESIMQSFLSKFYVSPQALPSTLHLHNEFEFMYTKAGRTQDIHVDIPPKFLSFVFYIPEITPAKEEDQRANATIAYDSNLEPMHSAMYKENSLCVFAPHFSSYHGFAATINREVLIAFYIQKEEQNKWQKLRKVGGDSDPFTEVKKRIFEKLSRHPLLEYQSHKNIDEDYLNCLINAPQGRVKSKD